MDRNLRFCSEQMHRLSVHQGTNPCAHLDFPCAHPSKTLCAHSLERGFLNVLGHATPFMNLFFLRTQPHGSIFLLRHRPGLRESLYTTIWLRILRRRNKSFTIAKTREIFPIRITVANICHSVNAVQWICSTFVFYHIVMDPSGQRTPVCETPA